MNHHKALIIILSLVLITSLITSCTSRDGKASSGPFAGKAIQGQTPAAHSALELGIPLDGPQADQPVATNSLTWPQEAGNVSVREGLASAMTSIVYVYNPEEKKYFIPQESTVADRIPEYQENNHWFETLIAGKKYNIITTAPALLQYPLPQTTGTHHKVNVTDLGFEPQILNISAGDTVEWVNSRSQSNLMIIGNNLCRSIKSSQFKPNVSFLAIFTQPQTCSISDGIITTQASSVNVR